MNILVYNNEMEKRYQVFVSSTYRDLKDERREAIQTIIEMEHIPASMEYFSALDENQWDYIKSVIDLCDYYILIIGARYGSLSDEDISYTEMEYDYAVEKNIPVIALLHKNPDNLPVNKAEIDHEKKEKLQKFKEKVRKGRLVDTWESKDSIPGKVSIGLSKAINRFKAIGWVRADQIASNDLLIEINNLRKENESLKKNIPLQKFEVEDVANFDDSLSINGTKKKVLPNGLVDELEQIDTFSTQTWRDIFRMISLPLINPIRQGTIKHELQTSIEKTEENMVGFDINYRLFNTILLQLKYYDLIRLKRFNHLYPEENLWELTEKGNQEMFKLCLIKTT